MEIKSIAEAKKTLQVEYDKFLTKPKENEYYRAGLKFGFDLVEELEKSVREKIIELEEAHASAPQEYWEEYDSRIKQLKEVLGEE